MMWEHDDTQGSGASQGKPRRRLRATPRAAALRLLKVRQRSVQDMRQRLKEKGFPAEDIERVLRDFGEQGLLDDVRFAEALVEHALARKPVGRRFLSTKLRQYRVPGEVAEGALARHLSPERETGFAKVAAERKLAEFRRHGLTTDGPEGAKRLVRFLLARGFSPEIIETVLEELKVRVH